MQVEPNRANEMLAGLKDKAKEPNSGKETPRNPM